MLDGFVVHETEHVRSSHEAEQQVAGQMRQTEELQEFAGEHARKELARLRVDGHALLGQLG